MTDEGARSRGGFDPTLWDQDEHGPRVQYLHDPMDPTYLHPPRSGHVPAGMLPAEELQLRVALAKLLHASAVGARREREEAGVFDLPPTPTESQKAPVA